MESFDAADLATMATTCREMGKTVFADESQKTALGNTDAIEKLVSAMKTCKSGGAEGEEAVIEVSKLLRSLLLNNAQNRARAGAAGAVEEAISMMKDRLSADAQVEAASLLAALLANSDENIKRGKEGGGLEQVVSAQVRNKAVPGAPQKLMMCMALLS